MKNIFIIMLFTCTFNVIKAQGKIVFNEPEALKSIFSNYISKNQAEKTIKGWRIQIISTSDRREMESVRAQFLNLYPNMPSSWKHVSPYYHVRVGAYREKVELLEKLAEIKKDFPASIPVQDDIAKYDLLHF
jgi:hypothetical protein